MEEAEAAAFQTTAEFAQTDAGVGLLSVLCTALLCCVKPVKDAWNGLAGRTKAKIFMAIGCIICLFDTIMDMIVVVEWFQDDSVWDAIPITILICILLPGIFSALISTDYLETTSNFSIAKIFAFFFCLIGFGSFVITVVTWNDLNGEKLGNYHMVRMFEIFVESAPAGALQIYILLKEGTYDFNLNIISIIGSILSLCIGMEEAIGKHLPLFDRIIFAISTLSDFLFRVVTMSFFMKQFALAQWTVVPCIYAFEFFILAKSYHENDPLDSIFILLILLPFAIPAVSTSAPVLLSDGGNFYNIVEIVGRLTLGVFFAIFSLLKEWEAGTAFIIIVSGTFSIVSSVRILYILSYNDAELKLLETDDYEKRLQVQPAKKQQIKQAPNTQNTNSSSTLSTQ